MKTTSKTLDFFCYDCFEDLLAPITFAKNFGFLAGVVSRIFAIENALQSKNQFLRNAFRKNIRLPHHNNRAQKLDSRNRMHVAYKFSVFARKFT